MSLLIVELTKVRFLSQVTRKLFSCELLIQKKKLFLVNILVPAMDDLSLNVLEMRLVEVFLERRKKKENTRWEIKFGGKMY